MSGTVHNIAEVDVNALEYSAPRDSTLNAGRNVFVNFRGAPLIVQLPEMSAPFGISSFNDAEKGAAFSLDLSFAGMDAAPPVAAFFAWLRDLDEHNIDVATANSAAWLKKKAGTSRDVISALYTRMLRYAVDKTTGEVVEKYAPTFKVKCPTSRDAEARFTFEAFDEQLRAVDVAAINSKGARCTCIVQCSSIWFASGKFGMSWKLLQLLIKPREVGLRPGVPAFLLPSGAPAVPASAPPAADLAPGPAYAAPEEDDEEPATRVFF